MEGGVGADPETLDLIGQEPYPRGRRVLNSCRKLKVRHPHPTHTPRKQQLMLQTTPVERRVEQYSSLGVSHISARSASQLSRSGCLWLSLLPSHMLNTQIPLFMPNLKTDTDRPTNDPSSWMPPLKTLKSTRSKGKIDQQDCVDFCAPKETASGM